MADGDPIPFQRRERAAIGSGALTSPGPSSGAMRHVGMVPLAAAPVVSFDRRELSAILRVYGRLVAAGESRDYAIDFGREVATFSIFRRASEMPLYRVEKSPKTARKQGAYSVVATTGLILKRGPDLERVLEVLDRKVLRSV